MPDDAKRPLKVFPSTDSGQASADTLSGTGKPRMRELYRTLKRRGLQPGRDAEDLLPGGV